MKRICPHHAAESGVRQANPWCRGRFDAKSERARHRRSLVGTLHDPVRRAVRSRHHLPRRRPGRPRGRRRRWRRPTSWSSGRRATAGRRTGRAPGSGRRRSGRPTTCRTTARGRTWRCASTRSRTSGCVDAGDVEMPPGEHERVAAGTSRRRCTPCRQPEPIPLVLGGDHSITLPDATGVARHLGFGKVSMIHFDAHADTGDIEFGSLYGHGQPMRRLIESGALRGDRFLQMGLRGYWPGPETLGWMAEQNMRSYEMTEIGKRGLDRVPRRGVRDRARRVRRRLPLRRHRRLRPRPRTGHRHARARWAVRARAARRRTPDLPRAARSPASTWSRCRRRTTTRRSPRSSPTGSASRRSPGWPSARSASPTTPPDRCWKGAEWAPPRSATARVFDGHRYRRAGAVVVERRSGRRRRVEVGSRQARPAPTDRGRRPGRRPARPRLHRRPRAPDPGRAGAAALRPVRARDPRGVPRRGPRVRRPRTPTSSGSSAAAGRCRPSRAARRPRPTSTRWCRTGRCSCPTATTTAPGSTAAALEIAGIDAQHPRPAGRPDRARRRRPPDRHPARGRDRPGRRGTCPRTTGDRLPRGAAGRPALPALARRHRAGRTRSSAPTPAWTTPARRTRRRPRTATCARTSSARSGGTAGTASSRSPTWSARREALTGGRFRADDRQDHAGRRRRERHRRDARRRTSTAAATRPTTAATRSSRPARCARPSPPSTPPASRCTCTRSATAASRETLDAFDGHRRRTAARTTSRTCSSSTPTTCRRFARARRRRQHAGAVGLLRRADGRPDAAVPRRGAGGAGSTPSATCTAPAPAWWPAATGRSPPPTRSRRSTSRSPARRTASGAGRHEPFLPEQALDLETAFAAYTSGSAWVEPPRRRAACSRPGAVADLVVLDRDPFAGPPEEIGASRVVSTWIDGERSTTDSRRARHEAIAVGARTSRRPPDR